MQSRPGMAMDLASPCVSLKAAKPYSSKEGVINYNADVSLWIKGSSLCFQSPYTVSLEQPIQDK